MSKNTRQPILWLQCLLRLSLRNSQIENSRSFTCPPCFWTICFDHYLIRSKPYFLDSWIAGYNSSYGLSLRRSMYHLFIFSAKSCVLIRRSRRKMEFHHGCHLKNIVSNQVQLFKILSNHTELFSRFDSQQRFFAIAP